MAEKCSFTNFYTAWSIPWSLQFLIHFSATLILSIKEWINGRSHCAVYNFYLYLGILLFQAFLINSVSHSGTTLCQEYICFPYININFVNSNRARDNFKLLYTNISVFLCHIKPKNNVSRKKIKHVSSNLNKLSLFNRNCDKVSKIPIINNSNNIKWKYIEFERNIYLFFP